MMSLDIDLVRWQILTPLSLLVNIAAVLACAVLARPSIADVVLSHPASISPHPGWLALYVVLVYLFQLGYCLLLVLATSPDTQASRRAPVKAVGPSLVLANWAMAAWAVAWVLRLFHLSTALLGIIVVLLVYANVALLVYDTPTYARPLDMALIHAPLRFFMLLPLSLMCPYSLFITLGLSYSPDHPDDYLRRPWPGFAVVMAVNAISLVVIVVRRDVVWAIAATWICISIWTAPPKPPPVLLALVSFTVLHPLALVSALVYDQLARRCGRIALPADDPERRPTPHGPGQEVEGT